MFSRDNMVDSEERAFASPSENLGPDLIDSLVYASRISDLDCLNDLMRRVSSQLS